MNNLSLFFYCNVNKKWHVNVFKERKQYEWPGIWFFIKNRLTKTIFSVQKTPAA